jgi:hypothetical protein
LITLERKHKKELAMFYQPVKNIVSSALNESIRMSISVVVATLMLFGSVATALAGGFQLSVEVPTATSTHRVKDAVLFVGTYGCHTPADAAVSATAEGIVNGERRSLPLEVAYDSTGIYAIKQQWPSEGSWVLAITGEYNSMTSTLIVDLGPGGKVHPGTRLEPGNNKGPHARLMRHKPTSADIDAALKTATGNISRLSDGGVIETPTSQSGRLVVSGMGAFFFLIGFVALNRRGRSKSTSALRDGSLNEDVLD